MQNVGRRPRSQRGTVIPRFSDAVDNSTRSPYLSLSYRVSSFIMSRRTNVASRMADLTFDDTIDNDEDTSEVFVVIHNGISRKCVSTKASNNIIVSCAVSENSIGIFDQRGSTFSQSLIFRTSALTREQHMRTTPLRSWRNTQIPPILALLDNRTLILNLTLKSLDHFTFPRTTLNVSLVADEDYGIYAMDATNSPPPTSVVLSPRTLLDIFYSH
jgi:hypothetical protein